MGVTKTQAGMSHLFPGMCPLLNPVYTLEGYPQVRLTHFLLFLLRVYRGGKGKNSRSYDPCLCPAS
jgi:hypothetical protein